MSEEKKVSGGRNDEFASAKEYKELSVEIQEDELLPSKIERSDIKAHRIQPGETEIILQRHGAYVRDRDSEEAGSLSAESSEAEKDAATAYFTAFLEGLSDEERATVDVLVVASDTQYFDKGRRSYETGSIAKTAAKEVFTRHGLSQDQILSTLGNFSGPDGPTIMPELREPNMLNDTPEFLDFMLEKYGGVNLDFWVAFEGDHHKEIREAMGAEGPDDIADRTGTAVTKLVEYSEHYHRSNPGRRLIVWAATHYDTISPFVKRDIFGVGKEKQLMVDYGAGITIDVDGEGRLTTELGDSAYEVPLKKSS